MMIYGKTDIGQKRLANQDDFVVSKVAGDVAYALVCDGMGGVNGGNVASSTAREAFCGKLDSFEAENPAFFGVSGDAILSLFRLANCWQISTSCR